MEVAAAAVAVLIPYLSQAGGAIAEQAGQAAVAGMKDLYAAVRRKFDADPDVAARSTLRELEEQPEDEARQAALIRVLVEKAAADPSFAEELSALMQGVTQGRTVNQFLTQVYGGNVGKVINIGEAKQVDIK